MIMIFFLVIQQFAPLHAKMAAATDQTTVNVSVDGLDFVVIWVYYDTYALATSIFKVLAT